MTGISGTCVIDLGPPFLIEHLNGKCYDFVQNK